MSCCRCRAVLRDLRYSIGDVRVSTEHCIHLTAYHALVWLEIHQSIAINSFVKCCACCNRCGSWFAIIHSKSFKNGTDVPALVDMEPPLTAILLNLDSKEGLQFPQVFHLKFCLQPFFDLVNRVEILSKN